MICSGRLLVQRRQRPANFFLPFDHGAEFGHGTQKVLLHLLMVGGADTRQRVEVGKFVQGLAPG